MFAQYITSKSCCQQVLFEQNALKYIIKVRKYRKNEIGRKSSARAF